MKHLTLIFPFILLSIEIAVAQISAIPEIDEKVNFIRSNQEFITEVFDAAEVYDLAFDGGGIIKLSLNGDSIKIISQEIGTSYGRLTTIIYLDQGKPIKIVEKEEDFKWIESESAWDYSELNQVFQLEIYVMDWESMTVHEVVSGNRVVSPERNDLSVFQDLIDLGIRLSKK